MSEEVDRTQAFDAEVTPAGRLDQTSAEISDETNVSPTGRRSLIRSAPAEPSSPQKRLSGTPARVAEFDVHRRELTDGDVVTPALGRRLASPGSGKESPFRRRSVSMTGQSRSRREDSGWSPHALFGVFVLLFNIKRMAFVTLTLWLSFALFALFHSVSDYIGAQIGALRSLSILLAWGTLLLSILFLSATISFQACRQLVDGEAASITEALDWFKGWTHTLLGLPLVVFGVASVAIILEALAGLLGRIPTIGPYLWSLSSPALIILSMGIGCLIVISSLTYGLVGPITYFERCSPVELFRRIMALCARQPFALVMLSVGSTLLNLVFIFLTVIPAWFIAMQVTSRVALGAFGPQLMAVLDAAPQHFSWMISLMMGLPTMVNDVLTLPTGQSASAVLLGLASGLIPAFIGGVFLVLQAAAGVVSYCVLTRPDMDDSPPGEIN